ncbi:MAG TPA: carboxypeptidase regulatory-like domain-containing protein [Blastocatellia bacterium]|nr:carboxypeptidase regulatory-like domain-containing protein [Blastocatellia bacterium]
MNRRSFLSALVLMLVLALAAAASAQRNTLRGKVRAPDGTSINNAIVELRISGSGMIGQTVTRNDGDFAFSGLESGEYEIAVTAAGFEPAVQIERFVNSDRMGFNEVLQVEIIVKRRTDPALPAPSTHFAQDVPKPARSAYEKAIAKLRDGKSEEGIALLREATANFNEYFDAHFALGRELFRTGRDNEALEELERARQINDRQDGLYHMFGLVMLKQQKYKIAQRVFSEAISINATNVQSHFYRAMALIELAIRESGAEREADFNDAAKELDRAWELSDKRMTEVYKQRARIYERRGNNEAAARELENYLKAEPDAKNAEAIRQAIAKLRGEKK